AAWHRGSERGPGGAGRAAGRRGTRAGLHCNLAHMPTSLVTGGAGFIGSHLVEALVKRNDRVRVLDNFATGTITNLVSVADEIELISGDVCDEAAVKRAVTGCDVVFHQA